MAGGADVTFQTNLEDGNYPRLSVLVTVTDEAGNESGPLSPGTFRVDNTPPEISSETAITYDNTTVTVTFDTVLYSNSTGTADGWQVDDFTASLSGGIAVTPIISSITNTVDGSGNGIVTLGITYTNLSDGRETLAIAPAQDAVVDFAGNAAITTQINNTVKLFDKTPPEPSGPIEVMNDADQPGNLVNRAGVDVI